MSSFIRVFSIFLGKQPDKLSFCQRTKCSPWCPLQIILWHKPHNSSHFGARAPQNNFEFEAVDLLHCIKIRPTVVLLLSFALAETNAVVMGDAWKNNASSKAWTRKLSKQTVRTASTDQIAADQVQRVKTKIKWGIAQLPKSCREMFRIAVFLGDNFPRSISSTTSRALTHVKSLWRDFYYRSWVFSRFVGFFSIGSDWLKKIRLMGHT